MSTSLENQDIKDNVRKDEITQRIKQAEDKELSYIMEASQADDKRTKFLAKKNEYKIIFDDGKEEIFKRKPLSSKKNKEIDDLRSAFINNRYGKTSDGTNRIVVNGRFFENQSDVLFEAYRMTAEYCLGMTSDQYDSAIWEDDPEFMDRDIYGLRSVLTACLLRAVHGIAYFPRP